MTTFPLVFDLFSIKKANSAGEVLRMGVFGVGLGYGMNAPEGYTPIDSAHKVLAYAPLVRALYAASEHVDDPFDPSPSPSLSAMAQAVSMFVSPDGRIAVAQVADGDVTLVLLLIESGICFVNQDAKKTTWSVRQVAIDDGVERARVATRFTA